MPLDKSIRPGDVAWKARLLAHLRQHGFNDAHALAGKYPLEYFTNLVKHIGPGVSAASFYRLLLEEAEERQATKQFAMSVLVRVLLREFPTGWGVGAKADFRRAKAFAAWLGILQRPYLTAEAERAWRRLKEIAPPTGWRPEGTGDLILTKCFEGTFEK